MILAGLAMLLGAKVMLPMPSMRPRASRGLMGVYGLGAFSGVASACCAPVLAGVAALSGAAGSFPSALAVGVVYVFGMVAPLTVLALVWDRRDWGAAKLLSGRTVTWRLHGHQRPVPLSGVISGALLLAMGALAVQGPAMGTDSWQIRASAALTHAAAVVRDLLGWVPGPVLSILVLGSPLALVLIALRSARRSATHHDPGPADEHQGADHCPPGDRVATARRGPHLAGSQTSADVEEHTLGKENFS